MILAGLIVALGEVVDDAIIDVENIIRRLRGPRGGQHQPRRGSSSKHRSKCAAPWCTQPSSCVLAFCRCSSWRGLSGSFFRPLALTYLWRCLASMVVALTVTPALCSCSWRGATLAARDLSAGPVAQARLPCGASRSSGTPASFAVARYCRGGRASRWPLLGEALLPKFKEMRLPDALGRQARHVAGRRRGGFTQASRELAAIPGVRNFGAHIGRAVAGRGRRPELHRELDQPRPQGRLRQDRARSRGRCRRLSGLYRDVDLSPRTDQGSAHRRQRRHRGADLRTRHGRAPAKAHEVEPR